MSGRKQPKLVAYPQAAILAIFLSGMASDGCADTGEQSSGDSLSDIFAPDELTPLACDAEASPLDLVALPDGVRLKFFHETKAPCALDDSTQMLLLNDSSEHVVVERVGTSGDRFTVHALDLPRDLAPGETLALEIAFRSTEPGDIGSILAVAGSGGCSQFKLAGHATSPEEGLVTYNVLQFDFGTVPPNSLSDEQQLRVVSIAPRDGKTDAPKGFSTSTPDWILGSPQVRRTSRCTVTTVPIRFMASEKTGLATGAVGWEVDSTTPDGEMFEGIQQIELRATVR